MSVCACFVPIQWIHQQQSHILITHLLFVSFTFIVHSSVKFAVSSIHSNSETIWNHPTESIPWVCVARGDSGGCGSGGDGSKVLIVKPFAINYSHKIYISIVLFVCVCGTWGDCNDDDCNGGFRLRCCALLLLLSRVFLLLLLFSFYRLFALSLPLSDSL